MLSANIKKISLLIILSLHLHTGYAEETVSKEGSISRAVFTSSVQNHEPIDQLNTLSQLISEVFYFTEFKHFQGQTLIHEWSHHGMLSHRVSFSVTGKRWRVHSSKAFKLGKQQEGTWTVKVLNQVGGILRESQINYIRPSTSAEIAQTVRIIEKKSLEASRKLQVIDKKSEHPEKVAKTESIATAPQTVATSSSQADISTTVVKEPTKPSSPTDVKNPSLASEEIAKVILKSDSDTSNKIDKIESNSSQENVDQRPIWDKI